MTVILLQRFANREYRLTHQDILSPKPKRSDKYAEVQAEKYAVAVHDTYVLQQELQQGEAALISDRGLERRSFGEVDARLGVRALDIIDEFRQASLTRKKGGWGFASQPTKFTRNARHRLLEGGAIVDKDCGKDAYEVTLTCPGDTQEAKDAIALWSGWLMDRLLREVRRAKCLYWFYVWEFQQRGALHIHLLVAGQQALTKGIAQSLEYQWWELLWELSEKTGIDIFRKNEKWSWKYRPDKWQSHCQPIQKSVAAYFSKYASKSANQIPAAIGKKAPKCPSRWWGCSSHLKNQIALTRTRHSVEVPNSLSTEILEHLQSWLNSRDRIKTYNYHFELGKTANGTNLGWGDVCINYYNDEGFARMQTWEKYVWQEVEDILRRHGYADMNTQTWTEVDIACKHPLDADMEKRRHDTGNADMKSRTSSPSPPNQQSSVRRKLSKSRGTQPKATLDLRARLVQFLAGGGGEVPTSNSDNLPHQPPSNCVTEYIQGELFNQELLRGY